MYKIVKEYLKTNGMLKPVVLEEVLAPGGNEGYLLTIEGDNMVIGDYFSNHTFTVDWGDGAVLSYENEYIVTHDYNTTGVYNIVIFDYVCGSLNMPNTGVISINTAMPKVNYTDFSGMFQNCGRLATVCDDLFYNNHQAENFGRMFLNCFSLKEIPAGLFKRCEKLTSLDGMFRNCYLITDIPHGILSQNPLIESVANMFDSCVSLQNVPSDLFYHNPLIYNFSSVFEGCRNLDNFPADVFNNNHGAKYFMRSFLNCSSLRYIDENIFGNNNNLINTNDCFKGCVSLFRAPDLEI